MMVLVPQKSFTETSQREIFWFEFQKNGILIKQMKNGETCAVSDFGLARTKSQEMDEGSTQAFVGPVKYRSDMHVI